MAKQLSTVSVVMATLNSMRTLPVVLEAIKRQAYPKKKIEFCFGDGGSTDGTREYIRKTLCTPSGCTGRSPGGWRVRIGNNSKLKTGEAGKAVGLRLAKGKYVALIDSDNILPSRDWLRRMVEPLESDPTIIGSEPIEYTYRRTDPPLTRYCALMGLNDPLVYFLGNYDRHNVLSGKWTEAPVKEMTNDQLPMANRRYRIVELDPRNLPTIGANGTVVRRALHAKVLGKSKYLFDIDEIAKLVAQGHNRFAKVEIGIIHLYAGSLSQFARKQLRRVRDYLYFQEIGIRKFTWQGPPAWRKVYFIMACLTALPLFHQSLKGYVKKPDPVWFYHPIYCWITLVVYGYGLISYRFRPGLASRKGWKQ